MFYEDLRGLIVFFIKIAFIQYCIFVDITQGQDICLT